MLRIALVYSMWHSHYIEQMRTKLKSFLNACGVVTIMEFEVPGSNEVPFKASKIAKNVDGVICVGILLKGDTLHFENVSSAVSNGIMQAQIKTGIPMMNCILSCLSMEQAIERITGSKCTLEYIAKALIKMVLE
jgi:6,7-dimethyl-8-ribityllumazine synthase